jgi:dihydrodipicolinate synthase/N-acetylneuraminate lyase
MFNALEAKDNKKAWAVYLKLLPFLKNLENGGCTQQTVKYAASKRGLNLGICRQPKLPMTDAQIAAVGAAIASLL